MTQQMDGNPFALLGDQPNVVGADPLGFGRVAKDLTQLVLASRGSTPFALGIEAEWGMGKSSLMGRLRDCLQEQRGVETLWFNAWTAGEGDVLEGLIKSVLEQMDPNILRRAARSQQLMSGLRIVTRVGGRWLRVGDMVDELWKQMSVDPNARNEMRTLVEGAMQDWRAKDAGVPGGRLLCVFVDDLDRCSPGNVFQVFEAIKLYLDAAGLVFVIGYHPAIVSQAILNQKQYADGVTPREYLEKIVQINYPIPAPDDSEARELVKSFVARSHTSDFFEDSMRSLVIERNARNPRRIKRFINNFILKFGLDPEWSAIGAPELIRVQILDMYFPDFARLLTEQTERDALVEFVDYVDVRKILRGDARRTGETWTRVQDVFRVNKLEPPPGEGELNGKPPPKDDAALLADLERVLPESFPDLADDDDFLKIVRSLRGSLQHERLSAKLARRERAPVAEPTEEPVAPTAVTRGLAGDVLWIDDKPSNNRYLAQALTRRGASVAEVPGIEEARRLLLARTAPFDLLISDIGRGGRRDAGLEDLESLRETGLYAGPAIFFASRITPARRAWAEKLGAAVTADSSELMRFAENRLAPAERPVAATAKATPA
jgi:CheY-like chemotaxis protein